MARIQCPCGCEYQVPEAQLGRRLTCRDCGRTFVAGAGGGKAAQALQAQPAEAPPSRAQAPKTPRLGELAVERGLVSREHTELCAKIQEALREQGVADKRIGEILVEKGLLKPEQIEMLLSEQSGEVREKAPPAPEVVPHPPRTPKPERRPEPDRPKPGERAGGVGVYAKWAGPPVLVVVLVALVVCFWPGPRAQRTLAAYLESCREGSIQPKSHLAIADPEFVIRQFRIEGLLEPTVHDFAPDTGVFNSRHDKGTWTELAAKAEMPVGKRRALDLVVPSLPEALTPANAGSFTITLQPVACYLFLKEPGSRFFKEGHYRVTMVRIQAAKWDSGWKFATYAPADAPSSQ